MVFCPCYESESFQDWFLANRTNGRAIGTVLRLSVVCRLWRYVLWLNGAS